MDVDYMISEGRSHQEILIEMRSKTGMTRKALAEYLRIPYRTFTDWERGERTMPEYVLRMMAYQLKTEGLFKEIH